MRRPSTPTVAFGGPSRLNPFGNLDMDEDEFGLISDLLRASVSLAAGGWTELMIRYYVEGDRSAQVVTCLVDGPQGVTEAALPYDPRVDASMRRLRDQLAQAGRPPFTQAKLHVRIDGEWRADYGYEPVDWTALLQPRWNFGAAAR